MTYTTVGYSTNINQPLTIQKQSPEVLCKGVLRNFAKFTGKYLFQSL